MKSREHIQNMSSANMESDNETQTLTKEQLKQKADTIHTKLDESIQQAKTDNTQESLEQARKLIKQYREAVYKLHPESNPERLTHKQYLSEIHPFLTETYKEYWVYNEDQLKTVESVTRNPNNIHIDKPIPFDEMVEINKDKNKRESNQSQIGELYITSESVDYEKAKVFIPDIPDNLKTVSDVMKYIHDTYKDSHILPDLRYYQYIYKLYEQYTTETDPTKKQSILDKIPQQLRPQGKMQYSFFPGSAFVGDGGRWVSPRLNWRGSDFRRRARGVEDGWDSRCSALLLER
ncbi:MAG TPA: hypothetical protein PJ997_03100 [Candidatus Paceibacterota bacterium]|nr:hypothetical protein [Candidatus Paceibacterota bacterium]